MKKIDVHLNSPYSVVFDSIDNLGKYVRELSNAQKAVIVTDENVERLYIDSAVSALQGEGFQVGWFVIDAGEQSKIPKTYLDVIDAFGEFGLKRKDVAIALGGGVVGDIAGFAAATYMRGIDFVQVPTTLLAAIDSSIGGKTGVDLEWGKNLLGAFHQPILVLEDLSLLSTLPKKEWKNGIGEGIKYACLAGGELNDILMKGLDAGNLERFVYLCVSYKAMIVEEDEMEGNIRRLLNLGHTVGHAIEKTSGYSVSHGVAVAQGIACIARAAKKAGELDEKSFDDIMALLAKYDMPCGEISKDVIAAMTMDKKAENSKKIAIVGVAELGKPFVKDMSFDELENYLS